MMSRRIFGIGVGVMLIAGTGLAWFSKPEPLRVSIERAGIKLTPAGYTGWYVASPEDQNRLRNLAVTLGYSYEFIRGIDDSQHLYTKEIPFLYFWHYKQTISVGGPINGEVHIEPAIR